MPALPLAHQPANQQHDTATAEVDVVWQSPTAAGLVRRNTDLVAVRFPHELDRFRLDEAGVGVGGKFRWQLVVDDRNGRGQMEVLVEKALAGVDLSENLCVLQDGVESLLALRPRTFSFPPRRMLSGDEMGK